MNHTERSQSCEILVTKFSRHCKSGIEFELELMKKGFTFSFLHLGKKLKLNIFIL